MDLTVSQLQYLDTIASLEGATVTAIAERLRVTKPSATVAVNRLINLGYLRKIPSSEDGRVHYLELTAEGGKLARFKQEATKDYQVFIESVLSPQELADFQSALQKLVTHYPQHFPQE